ncbi:MAG TPA: GNAT family N-acetyltransferase [Verrucomicrobiaceae bacterium]
MNIRRASVTDLPSLLALTKECVARMRSQGIEQWDEIYPDEPVLQQDIVSGTLHVLEGTDELAGCVIVDDRPDPLWQGLKWSEEGVPFAAVHRLMVHPVHQGRGLGKKLMEHAEVTAREQGRRSIRLDTFTANPIALSLYEKLGYRRTGFALMRKGQFVGFEKML